ncbi:MarR family transcriptional regulator [Azospirillum picis]|uniref:MarR family transcriptional regulator n=1 Tax=Azospirillum picis TaxID=488438 RepID=A0ABU0MU97_9PROT|nr:MarR family transcriptional regulator [Azospirillum picis]MBP2302919.1 hypothetical protein [Azospirillum picis]MDQ0536671.1 hypothetical protein [Azospirillum picis]
MKPYIDMYRRWISVPGIQAADIAVLSALYAHADRDGVCTATQGELAEELGQSRAWFNAVLKGLQEPATALVCAQSRRGLRGFAYRLSDFAAGAASGIGGAGPADAFCQPADRSGPQAGFSLESGNPESSSFPPRGGAASDLGTNGAVGPLPSDWQPDAADLAWASQQRPDVDADRVTPKFVAWCRKAHRRNGYRPPDPSAAWRRWIARELVSPSHPEPPAASAPSASIPPSRREARHDLHQDRRAIRSSDARPAGQARTGQPVAAVRNRETLAALRLRLAGQA